jgi:hypothetical protein
MDAASQAAALGRRFDQGAKPAVRQKKRPPEVGAFGLMQFAEAATIYVRLFSLCEQHRKMRRHKEGQWLSMRRS